MVVKKQGVPAAKVEPPIVPDTVGESVAEYAVVPKPRQARAAENIPDKARGNAFETIMHDVAADHQRAIEGIRAGFPANIIKDTSAYFDVPAHRIRSIVGLPETTAHTLVKRGANLDVAASERIWRIADLMLMATSLFENDESAKMWLRTPNRAFRDAAPMDYLDTEPGAIAVRQVLNAIGSGGVA
jgi:putative toxin-antitoxin system antitoxin component (TIGR02293 family)